MPSAASAPKDKDEEGKPVDTAMDAPRSSGSSLAFTFAEVLFTFLLPMAIIIVIVQNSGKMPGKPQP